MDELKNQIGALLNNPVDREAALKNTLEHVLAELRSETGTIHLLDTGKQLLHLTAQIGLPPHMLELVKTIPVGKGIAGQTVAQNRPVTLCNLQADTSGVAKPAARQTGVGGALCVPLRNHGKIVGTLGIGTRHQHEFTVEQTKRLEEIGELIGASVAS
jgi:GAF domain-containing protein